MPSLDWHLTRTDDVTFVELLVESDVAERVTIESNLRPVWPPRRHGRPAAGWTEAGFEGLVPEDGSLVLGYASPAAPTEPPAEVTDQRPADGATTGPSAEDDRPTANVTCGVAHGEGVGAVTAEQPLTPRALVRALGEAAPPRAAVPTPDERATPKRAAGDGGQRDETETPAASAQAEKEARDASLGSESEATGDPASGTRVSTEPDGERRRESDEPAPPDALASWLDGVETRLDEAERLAAADDAREAREAIATAGGVEAVRRLRTRLAADREQLAELDARREDLDARLAAVEVPLSTLERVA